MSVSKNSVLLISIIVTLAIILASLLKWDYMWENEFLSKWASIVTMISLGISPVVYFWKKRQDSIDERSQASKNLHIELNDALDGLNEERHTRDLRKAKIPNGEEYYFMNRMFNHDFYDSLVFSGKINFLPPEIQQSTQDTFQKIKDHNNHLRKIRDIENDAKEEEDVSKKTERYYKMLDKIEKELLSGIPAVKEKLAEEFKID